MGWPAGSNILRGASQKAVGADFDSAIICPLLKQLSWTCMCVTLYIPLPSYCVGRLAPCIPVLMVLGC